MALRLAFESTRSGTSEVWTSDADGSNAVALTAFGGPWTGTARWSPDGRFIAFDSHADRGSNIHVVSAAGGLPRRVDTRVDDSSEPAWSNDGRWLYFTGVIGGAQQIVRVPIEGGEPTPLTTQGGATPGLRLLMGESTTARIRRYGPSPRRAAMSDR